MSGIGPISPVSTPISPISWGSEVTKAPEKTVSTPSAPPDTIMSHKDAAKALPSAPSYGQDKVASAEDPSAKVSAKTELTKGLYTASSKRRPQLEPPVPMEEGQLQQLFYNMEEPLDNIAANAAGKKTNDATLFRAYVAARLALKEMREEHNAFRLSILSRMHEEKKEITEEAFSREADIAKKKETSDTLSWINWGAMGGALVTLVAGVLTAGTGGAGAAAIIAAEAGLGLITAGASVSKGVIDDQKQKEEGELLGNRVEEEVLDNGIKQLLQEFQTSIREVTDQVRALRKIADSRQYAVRW